MRIIQWTGRWFPVVFTLVMLVGALFGRLESLIIDIPPLWFSFLIGLESLSLLFVGLFLQALPFLLLGAVVSGVIGSAANPGWLMQYLPESALGQVFMGALSGLWLPVGETGTIPLAKQFRKLRIPSRFIIAFLVAAPVVNPITIASLWVVFGSGFIMIGCVVMALVAALVTGVVVEVETGVNHSQKEVPRKIIKTSEEQISRFQRAVVIAVDLLFETGRWLVLGIMVSALSMVVFRPGRLISEGLGGIDWVVVSGILGVLHSNEVNSAPFTLMPLMGLIPRGAIISAIVVGSQASLKRVFMLRSVFEGRVWFEIILIPVAISIVAASGMVTFLHW
jgi:uncharacterized protein